MIEGISKSMIQDKNYTLVTDMDEVITNISPYWYKLLLDNKDIFGKYLDLNKAKTVEEVMQRNHYYLNKWLIRDGYEDLPDKEMAQFLALYLQEDFYDNCVLTSFGTGLKSLSHKDWVDKIYIVSHTINGQDHRKERFLRNNNFNLSNIELIMVDGETPKSEIINKHSIDYNTFVDDRPKILEDVIKNTNSDGKEFLFPFLGYNIESELIEELSKSHRFDLQGYKKVL
jgi:hypothetical protein